MSIEYAKLSNAQKWQWHADVYAFRRVVLGADREEHTSPCDTEGKWFDERLVDAAERRLRSKYAEQLRRCRASTEAYNAIRFADAERWRRARGATA